MNLIKLKISGMALLALMVAPGFATAKDGLGLYVLAGATRLTDHDSREFTRATGLNVGLGYGLDWDFLGDNAMNSLEVNWLRTARDRNSITSFNFGLVSRRGIDGGNANGLYAGYGIGFDQRRVKREETILVRGNSSGGGGSSGGGSSGGGSNGNNGILNSLGSGESADGLVLSGRLILGYRFNSRTFAEISYRHAGEVANASHNGFGLSIGIQF